MEFETFRVGDNGVAEPLKVTILGLLRAAREALRPDGICLIQEITSGERLTDNRGPAGAVLYGFSLLTAPRNRWRPAGRHWAPAACPSHGCGRCACGPGSPASTAWPRASWTRSTSPGRSVLGVGEPIGSPDPM
jgi:hypothetical protein